MQYIGVAATMTEHRSSANMLEVLIREHCRIKGIARDDLTNNKRTAEGANS